MSTIARNSYKIFFFVLVLFIFGWGVTKAETFISPKHIDPRPTTSVGFSAIGFISNIGVNFINIRDAKSSDKTGNTNYTFDVSYITKVETKDYIPLILSDLRSGDKIIVQGTYVGNDIRINRVISFNTAIIKQENSSSTVSVSLEELGTTSPASSSDSIATSTENSNPSLFDKIKDTVSNIISNVVNAITGSSTPKEATSSDSNATSTNNSTSTDNSTTTNNSGGSSIYSEINNSSSSASSSSSDASDVKSTSSPSVDATSSNNGAGSSTSNLNTPADPIVPTTPATSSAGDSNTSSSAVQSAPPANTDTQNNSSTTN